MNCLMVLLALGIPVFAKATIGEVIPPYTVTKVIVDKSLPKGEAKFVFTCHDIGDSMGKKKVLYSVNGKDYTASLSATNSFTAMVSPGKYRFQFYIDIDSEELETDSIEIKDRNKTEVDLYFRKTKELRPMKKPVIYLYPEKETAVNVRLDVKDGLQFTYPLYKNGWQFTANPNGDLEFGDKTFGYLFWEGMARFETNDISSNAGFVVDKDELTSFFENKLAEMGLSAKERADFITYWNPLMLKNDAYYIRFLFNEQVEKYAELTIEPKPDHVFRVFMVWTPIDCGIQLLLPTKQKLPSVKREGFTVIEWGGTEWDPEKP
ncbi:MAG: hypothetical protein K0S33_1311 [Bacteroidetes bacterium]|nr:hypothetical protein [Bacteroidota bacterium]